MKKAWPGILQGFFVGGVFLFLQGAVVAFAGTWNVNDENVLLDGYDLVAYQTEHKAVKGSPFHAAMVDGVILHFVSQENVLKFHRNPGKYVPKYNGFCAFAVAKKKARVPSNPETFKILEGKLFMFFNDMHEGKMVNTKVFWDQMEDSLYPMAEENWAHLK